MTAALLVVGLALPAVAAKPAPEPADSTGKRAVRIALVYDGAWDMEGVITQLATDEIRKLNEREFDIQFPKAKIARGDWSPESVHLALDGLLADPEIDLILTLGPLSSLDLASRGPLPKPALAGLMPDIGVDLPEEGGASGVENLSYVVAHYDFDRDLRLFQDVVRFESLAVLCPAPFIELSKGLGAKLAESAKRAGVKLQVFPVGRDADSILAAIPKDIEAVFLAPLPQMPQHELDLLIRGLIERKLPSWSRMGRALVERGVLAGAAPVQDLERRARRIALNIQRILLGEKPSSLQSRFSEGQRLVINMATARAIRRLPSWGVLTEAELLHERRPAYDRKISLSSVVREALGVNLDLETADREVAAGAEDVGVARAGLLPQLDVGALGRIIDDDRAAASLGQAPEREVAATARVREILYNDGLWARLTIEERLQEARTLKREATRLDVAARAARAFLDVLRARTLERIEKENLLRARENLELARVRVDIGQAHAGEVYRWDNEIARSRKSVIDMKAARHLAELSLNQVLHRPQEEGFTTVEAGLADPALITSDPQLFAYFDDPWRFNVFRDFMVKEALQNAPELGQLDAAIAAGERAIIAEGRRLWAPTVALQGDLTQHLAEGGEGTEGLALPPQAGVIIPEADDTDWTAALSVSLPLFDGGDRYASRRKAVEELGRLRSEKRAAAEKIEQRVRASLHLAGASFPGIGLTRDSAVASQKNLELVTDAYQRGAVSIIELIDAQNVSRIASQASQNAVFDFLVDLMEVERASARFDFFIGEAERKAWFERLHAWFLRAQEERNP